MKPLYEEDLYDIHPNTQLTDCLSNEDLCLSQNVPIIVRYNLIDLNRTKYHFKQEFKSNETNLYFERMYELSILTINKIEDSNIQNRIHFYRSGIKGNLKSVLAEINPKIVKANPLIFHFALDPGNNNYANREKSIRNPRVYFMLGMNGAIHILFFDPYHEINP